MLSQQLHGVIPPLVTPLTEERRFDRDSAERLAAHMLECGVQALFVLGTSGEGPYLAQRERELVIRAAVEAAAGRVPVFAGVLEPGTEEAIQQARLAERAGAAAVVVSAPYYFPVDQQGVRKHFRSVGAAVELPVLAYDIPRTTHVKIRAETILDLAAEGTIVGVKDSSGDLDGFRRLLVQSAGTLRAFTGSELVVDAVLSLGGAGVVPGLANVAPQPFVELYRAWTEGDRERVVHQQERIVSLFEVFLQPDGTVDLSRAIGVMKAALFLRGILSCTRTSRPLPDVSHKDLERTRRILIDNGLL